MDDREKRKQEKLERRQQKEFEKQLARQQRQREKELVERLKEQERQEKLERQQEKRLQKMQHKLRKKEVERNSEEREKTKKRFPFGRKQSEDAPTSTGVAQTNDDAKPAKTRRGKKPKEPKEPRVREPRERRRGKSPLKKVLTAIVVLAILAGGAFGGWMIYQRVSSSEAGEVYVSSVASLTGNLENGMRNRYAGVVESQETWSAKLSSGKEIKEFYVKVGDQVAAGADLFIYDTASDEESLQNEQIELQRQQDELASMNEDLKELNTEKNETSDQTAKAELTVEIQQKELDIKSRNYDIESKQKEIAKLEESIKNAVVKSEITGVVKMINDGETEVNSNDAITVVNAGSFRVKGRVNEQNLVSLQTGLPVIVFSRVNDALYWQGTIAKIDTENALTAGSDEYGDGMTTSTNYPFYITLNDSDGLVMGQHVYIEADVGQLNNADAANIWLDEYMVADADSGAPYVWVDDNGRLSKRTVTLGEHDDAAMTWQILEGLVLSDRIAQPEDSLSEGMRTVDMNELSEDNADTTEDDDSEDFGEEDYTTIEDGDGEVYMMDDGTGEE